MSTMSQKVEHVLAGTQFRKHNCHWPGCKTQVPPAKWGCLHHWRPLPQSLRLALWQAYTPGQEILGNPSRQYILAARAIQRWITSNTAEKVTEQGQLRIGLNPSVEA